MAEIRPVSTTIQVGRPVWVDFVIINPTGSPVTLTHPSGDSAEAGSPEMGLPMGHVFSGDGFDSVRVMSSKHRVLSDRVGAVPTGGATTIKVAPGASVGRRIDLSVHYRDLTRAGTYHLQWKPYGGGMESNTVVVTVTSLKQAVITTDFGRMTIRFNYDQAPRHTRNFIELARKGFYDSTLIHRVLPGVLIQAGDPQGDGTGVRPDGVTLKAERSAIPFEVGTVAMARKPDDPDSASCQFFVCLTRIREFDGQYSVFGQLVGDESFETLRRLGQIPTDGPPSDRPIEPLYLRSVTIGDVPADRVDTAYSVNNAGESSSGKPAVTSDTPVPLAPVATAGSVDVPAAQTVSQTVAPNDE